MSFMSEQDAKSVVMSYLTTEFFFEFGGDGDNADTDLFESERLDSLAFVKLISFLEETFDVTFHVSALQPEAFRTVNVICETLREHFVDSSAA